MNFPDLCQGIFDRNLVESLRNTDMTCYLRRTQDSTKFLSCFVHLHVLQEISFFYSTTCYVSLY